MLTNFVVFVGVVDIIFIIRFSTFCNAIKNDPLCMCIQIKRIVHSIYRSISSYKRWNRGSDGNGYNIKKHICIKVCFTRHNILCFKCTISKCHETHKTNNTNRKPILSNIFVLNLVRLRKCVVDTRRHICILRNNKKYVRHNALLSRFSS